MYLGSRKSKRRRNLCGKKSDVGGERTLGLMLRTLRSMTLVGPDFDKEFTELIGRCQSGIQVGA